MKNFWSHQNLVQTLGNDSSLPFNVLPKMLKYFQNTSIFQTIIMKLRFTFYGHEITFPMFFQR